MSAMILVGPLCADVHCKHRSCYHISWQAAWMIEMHRVTTPELDKPE